MAENGKPPSLIQDGWNPAIPFTAQFIGKALPVDAGEVDAIAGATITTSAMIEALNSLAE